MIDLPIYSYGKMKYFIHIYSFIVHLFSLPSPCGENSQCVSQNGIAKCTCIPPYIGDAYGAGCRPECQYNADCVSGMACIRQHCRDPCRGVCGQNAKCYVVNHIPVCTCETNYEGDPFSGCRPIPTLRKCLLHK